MCTVLHALTFGCWQDERERETAIHQRLEKKWLGNIRIPFSTIYLNGKVSLSVFWALWATSKTLSPPSGKVGLSILSGTSGFHPIARTGIFFGTCGFHSITKSQT